MTTEALEARVARMVADARGRQPARRRRPRCRARAVAISVAGSLSAAPESASCQYADTPTNRRRVALCHRRRIAASASRSRRGLAQAAARPSILNGRQAGDALATAGQTLTRWRYAPTSRCSTSPIATRCAPRVAAIELQARPRSTSSSTTPASSAAGRSSTSRRQDWDDDHRDQPHRAVRRVAGRAARE